MEDNYPVLLRMSTVSSIALDFQTGKIGESKERSFSFRAAQPEWLHQDELDQGMKYIFVSKTCYDELKILSTFMPHWVEGKGWMASNKLSPESRQELLQIAMGMRMRKEVSK